MFGRRNLCGLEIGEVLPNFRRLVHFLVKEQKLQTRRRNSINFGAALEVAVIADKDDDENILEEGTVVPEHAFRRAEAMLEFRQAAGADMTPSTSSTGSTGSMESEVLEMAGPISLNGSEDDTPLNEEQRSEGSDDSTPRTSLGERLLSGGLLIKPHGLKGIHRDGGEVLVDVQMRVVRPTSENDTVGRIYYALWITYSGPRLHIPPLTPLPPVEPETPLTSYPPSGETLSSDDEIAPEEPRRRRSSVLVEPVGIDAWDIVEDMGEGAYGSVKLVRHRVQPDRVPVPHLSYPTR